MKGLSNLPNLQSDDRARDYAPCNFPIIAASVGEKEDRELLFNLYNQICQSWRELLGIRFKLLAIVPPASFISIAQLFSVNSKLAGLRPAHLPAIALLGLVVTVGLYLYERRNSELYQDLASRARRIESELGVHTGQFLGRLEHRYFWMSHNFAIALVYLAAGMAWGLAAIVL